MELRENGTQAVIASILPGEEVILTATAEIPEDFTEEELINSVLVSAEGGEKGGKSDQVAVTVEQELPKRPVSSNQKLNSPQQTPAATPTSGQSRTSYLITATPGTAYYTAGTQTDGKGTAYTSPPKTGDESPVLLLIVLAGGAGAVIFIILRYRSRRNKPENQQ